MGDHRLDRIHADEFINHMVSEAETDAAIREANDIRIASRWIEDIERAPNDVMQFVADLPLQEANCSFNTARHGYHRQCEKYAKQVIEGHSFCDRHAQIVKKNMRPEQKTKLA